MANRKKYLYRIHDEILDKLRVLSKFESKSIGEVIDDLLIESLEIRLREMKVKNEYIKMGYINSELAEMFLREEFEELKQYERWLKEFDDD